ncbi:MAG: hypothetical protein ACTSUF_02200 [Candidatus Heimdallarchaeaceae archaeon]
MEYEEITHKEFKKYLSSLIKSQTKNLSLLVREYEESKNPETYTRIVSVFNSVETNKRLLESSDAYKDEAIFYLDDYVPGYKIIGKELKKRHDRKIKDGEVAYV